MNRLSLALGLALVCSAAPIATAQVTVTTGPTSGTALFSAQNDGYVASWGQTFRTPDAANTTLDRWSFWLQLPAGDPMATFRLRLFEWPGLGCIAPCAGSNALGDVVFESGAVTPVGSDAVQQVSFDVGFTLDPTRTYLAFLAASPASGFAGASGALGYVCEFAGCGTASQTYAGGSLVYLYSVEDADNPGGYLPMSVAAGGTDYGQLYDAQFEAEFSAVPEPATITLMATGLAGLAGAARRRRRNKA